MKRKRTHKRSLGTRPFSGSRFVVGGKVWIEWWAHGQRRTKVLGRNTKALRERADETLESALDAARAVSEGKPAVASNDPTLAELFHRYSDDAKRRTVKRTGQKLRPATLERYADYRMVLVASLGMQGEDEPAPGAPRLAKDLTRRHVRAFIRHAQDTGMGGGTLARLVDHLRQVYKWAVSEDESLEADPIAGVKSPGHKADVPPYTREEARRLYEALLRPRTDALGRKVATDWRFRVVALQIVIYGVRESQARHVRWPDVDLDAVTTVEGTLYHGTITFKQANRGSKGQRDRTLPMHPAVRQAVVAAWNHHTDPLGYVAWNQRAPAEPCDYESMQRQLHLREAAEGVATVKGRAWHSLRRALMTLLVEELGVAQAAALTGDSPEVILRTYVKVSKEAVGQAVAAVSRAFPAESLSSRDHEQEAVG